MAEANDPSSDTSADMTWPVDTSIENQQQERVVFEDVAEHYVEGEDVAVRFSFPREVNLNEEEDQIGLIRIGARDMKRCLAYADVHFDDSSSSSIRHGTATFPAAALPAAEDEFYQFCYLLNKTKNLGTSTSFQLNCKAADMDLLSNSPMNIAKGGSLIPIDDPDDGFVVMIPKHELMEKNLRQENRRLSEVNHRLQTEKDELQIRLDGSDQKRKTEIGKMRDKIQSLDAARQVVEDELSALREADALLRAEHEACRARCDQHQNANADQQQRLVKLQDSNDQHLAELTQTRNQLAVTTQLTKDQATQIIDFERRLLQANELTKSANQRNALLEQHIRESRASSEKQQLSMEAKIDDYTRLIEQLENQIRALQETHHLSKEELSALTAEKQELMEQSNQQKASTQRLQQELEDRRTNGQKESSMLRQQMQQLREQLSEQAETVAALRQSMTEIQRRCLKHQKGEVEAKRQLVGYQDMIRDLEHQIHDLKDRLALGSEEYRNLFRKFTILEQSQTNSLEPKREVAEQLPPPAPTTTAPADDDREDDREEEELERVLNNTTPPKDNDDRRSFPKVDRDSIVNIDVVVSTCPVCNWDFPKNLTVEGKQQHIEEHFN